MKNQNPPVQQTGLLWRTPSPEDYIMGGRTSVLPEVRLESGDWTPYVPTFEPQYAATFDTMSCVTFSALNTCEMQINYLIATLQLPSEALAFFKDNGYMDSAGKVNFSDRFIAILSGTTKNGNYFDTVWNTIRKYGLLPESKLPFAGKNWDEYMNPGVVTDDMKNLARRVLYYLNFQFEWVFFDNDIDIAPVPLLKTEMALKMAPLHIGIPIPAGHAIAMLNMKPKTSYGTLDTYPPYVFNRAWSLPVHFALKGYVSPLSHSQARPKFMHDLSLGTIHTDVIALQKFLNEDAETLVATTGTGSIGRESTYFGTKTQAALMRFQAKYNITPVAGYFGTKTRDFINSFSAPKASKIDAWCAAIKSREGWFTPGQSPNFPKGSPSYVNNNPGNLKFVGQARALNMGRPDGSTFCVFRSYDDGYAELRDLLVRACTPPDTATYQANMTLLDFYKKYAPKEDQNDPASYANEVAHKLQVETFTKIKELL